MINLFQEHPFDVEAFFQSTVVISFAAPKHQLKHLLPPCFELDTLDDHFAFIAAALVSTKHLRPKGFPKFIGSDFFLVGYRLFVRYKNNAGKTLRGLYILQSETDKWSMQILGNVFTRYRYRHIDVQCTMEENLHHIFSVKSGIDITYKFPYAGEIALPETSPFKDWKQARRFAGPLPFTFSYNPQKQMVTMVEGQRENWTPAPLKLEHCRFGIIDNLKIEGLMLANAFITTGISYNWKKGRVEPWKP